MNNIKVLKVIHGYPPYYMAGSEVYTYKLTQALKDKVNLIVFSRVEDPYQSLYHVDKDVYHDIEVIRINKNKRDYLFHEKYLDPEIDKIFEEYLLNIEPDIVHIGHLSHLSTSIIKLIHERNIPIIFTLHDFWMLCLRGQLITPAFELCDGPSLDRCSKCMSYYFNSRAEAISAFEKSFSHFNKIIRLVDLFIAPSKYLKTVYERNGVPAEKILYMDYGFDKTPFKNFEKKAITRNNNGKITFAFTGRVIPVKGIDLLIKSFNKLDPNKVRLHIYGKIQGSSYLKKLINGRDNIHLKGSYHNDKIADVFHDIDVLVVPSIWYENSPLVIHEAFMAKIPVITTNLGGMAELVQHGKNGLLFERNNVDDLVKKMQSFVDNPDLTNDLNQSVTPVRSIEQDAQDIYNLYLGLIRKN